MGAVSAQADGVLEDELVVGCGTRLIAIVLDAEAPELARRIIGHDAVAPRRRIEIVERRSGEGGAERRRLNLIIAHADTPERHELVDALNVEAHLDARREI